MALLIHLWHRCRYTNKDKLISLRKGNEAEALYSPRRGWIPPEEIITEQVCLQCSWLGEECVCICEVKGELLQPPHRARRRITEDKHRSCGIAGRIPEGELHQVPLVKPPEWTTMFFRIPRLTPGYIRYLQVSVLL